MHFSYEIDDLSAAFDANVNISISTKRRRPAMHVPVDGSGADGGSGVDGEGAHGTQATDSDDDEYGT